MSSGNNGMGGAPEGDDPFGYLYRPEGGGQGPAPQAPPTYQQVRPVGERQYGQRTAAGGGGYGYPPQQSPDARYAAPETVPGGPAGGGRPGHGHGPEGEEPPRRNGLLIGAIAVVTAVVLGVGAAILFSGDDDQDPAANSGTGTGENADPADEPENQNGEDDPEESAAPEESEEPVELPEAGLTSLALSGGAVLAGDIANARSADGTYITGLNTPGATVSWTFDFEGEPGVYRLYIGYSVPKGDQEMSFAVNSDSEIRSDPLEFKDYAKNDAFDKNWVRTWKNVELVEGSNVIHMGCDQGDKCDVLIDKILITENKDIPQW
ncbi:hypothetical protein [Streptomyces aidingensis]|uniref:CBM6 domain-containing protein n=1 Tax=Streptomyces aidingensis TaxID=910347 RepID=A0A1I1HQF4_9ACTN|nr:hypothetical protein [Streptomyces aidingensis]SFC24188.1 hypothetical protein SAMN05421773_102416 [Streptomyces aidingensis]